MSGGGSIRPAQRTVEAVPAAVFDRRCDDLVGGARLVEFLRQALRDDRLLARVQIARVEVEIAVLHLVITHDDRRAALGKRIRQIPGSDMRLLGIDDQAQPIERIVGRVRLDQRSEARAAVERALPQVEIAGLAFPDA